MYFLSMPQFFIFYICTFFTVFIFRYADVSSIAIFRHAPYILRYTLYSRMSMQKGIGVIFQIEEGLFTLLFLNELPFVLLILVRFPDCYSSGFVFQNIGFCQVFAFFSFSILWLTIVHLVWHQLVEVKFIFLICQLSFYIYQQMENT